MFPLEVQRGEVQEIQFERVFIFVSGAGEGVLLGRQVSRVARAVRIQEGPLVGFTFGIHFKAGEVGGVLRWELQHGRGAFLGVFLPVVEV